LNVAVTARAALIVTVHVAPDAASQPLQPVNCEFGAAAAVSVTDVPSVYGSEQSAPQSIPEGVEVTVPAPPPVVLTLKV